MRVEDRHYQLAKRWMWQGFTSRCAQDIADWEARRIAEILHEFGKIQPREALFVEQWMKESGYVETTTKRKPMTDLDFQLFCEETGRDYKQYANIYLFLEFAEWSAMARAGEPGKREERGR